MHRLLCGELRCPFCGRDLALSSILRSAGDEILYGTLTCGCRTYPIVEGIALIRAGSLFREASAKILSGEPARALALLLGPPPARHRLLNHLLRDLSRALSTPCLEAALQRWNERNDLLRDPHRRPSFPELLRRWAWGEEGIYFQHRFSTTGFLATLPYLAALPWSGERVLDLCSGMGHLLFLMGKYLDPASTFGVDIDFRKLFISREIFSPASTYVCLDANYPLPFKTATFGTIVCSDAFHYIDAKSTASVEMERVLGPEGRIYLFHLHNVLRTNPYPGTPLSPEGYGRLFSRLKVRLFPEAFVMRNFLEGNRLVLDPGFAAADLRREAVLHAVACDPDDLLEGYKGVWEFLLSGMRKSVMNPVYRVSGGGERLHLKRRFPSAFFASEQSFMSTILPEEIVLPVEMIRADGHGKSPEREELIKKFVLIDLPDGYCDSGPLATGAACDRPGEA